MQDFFVLFKKFLLSLYQTEFNMKLRTVTKLGVILSVILFGIGIGLYSFAKLSINDQKNDVDFLSFIPGNCIGVFETDNADYFLNEFTQMAYASQLGTLHQTGITGTILDKLNQYAPTNIHGLNGQTNHMLVSFHSPGKPDDAVVYFSMGKEGKDLLIETLRNSSGSQFIPKKEKYRDKTIEIYPVNPTKFIVLYYNNEGLSAISYQKRLIEEVIDAQKDKTSLRQDPIFTAIRRTKSTNFMTLYGRTAPLPLLTKESNIPHWSEFDIHLNSEVFYLSGEMHEPDSCIASTFTALNNLSSHMEDSLLLVSGTNKVDSCISSTITSPSHTLFEECISNLSRNASCIMVADMDKVAKSPQEYEPYLPQFILRHPDFFRSFIISLQITKIDNRLSHIFVFTYKN